jgi:alpha-D-ribose 1-methylphosphonate 5-triphosphate diphosphatase PhnM
VSSQNSLLPPSKKLESVHKAALAFDKANRAAKKASAKKADARTTLVAAMEERDITVYKHADVTVELVDRIEPKVQVGVQEQSGQPD